MATLNNIEYFDVKDSGQVQCSNGYWSARRQVICNWDSSLGLMIALVGKVAKQNNAVFVVSGAAKYPLEVGNGTIPDLVPKTIRREKALGTPGLAIQGGPRANQAILSIEYGENSLLSAFEECNYTSEVLTVFRGTGVKYASTASADVKNKPVSEPLVRPLQTSIRSFNFLSCTTTDIEALEENGAFDCVNSINSDIISIPRVGHKAYNINPGTALLMGIRYTTQMAEVYDMQGALIRNLGREPLYDVTLSFKIRGVYDTGTSKVTSEGWNQVFCAQSGAWEDLSPKIFRETLMHQWLNSYLFNRQLR